MLIISDGHYYGISATFPLPYGFLSKVGLFERQRWIRLSPVFKLLGLALSVVLLLLLVMLHPAPTDASAFVGIGATGLILLKQFVQKKVSYPVPRAFA